MRRLLWVAVGAVSTVATLRKAREVADRHVPAGARSALGAAAGATALAQRALAELRAGTAEREAELRADLLAGADLPHARARLDAWRAERAERAAGPQAHDGTDPAPDRRVGHAAGQAGTSAARPGSAAAAGRRGAASPRPEDPDDGSLGYSFF